MMNATRHACIKGCVYKGSMKEYPGTGKSIKRERAWLSLRAGF
jgi:hypothetical protein